MRAILSIDGATWQAETEAPEPWDFGEAIFSKVIRYRGDLAALASDLAGGSTRAWSRLGERGAKTKPTDDDWLYELDAAARTLRVSRAGVELVTATFNERGRSNPISIDRPAERWASIPTEPTETGQVSSFVADHFGERLAGVRAAAQAAVASRLELTETRAVYPIRPEAAYVEVDLGEQRLLIPSPAWRHAAGWRQRSPNELRIWVPPHDESVLDLSPARFAKDLEPQWNSELGSPTELTYALITGAFFARGGKGELRYVHAPLPERQWTVVEKGGDPNVHIAQKDKRIKKKKLAVGARFARDVDCPGWQWVLLDWLAGA
ncbi:MAG: hypothetical protein GY913_15615 [Proteobacteria bacterium]|nr:hypothetical protein [Pseudomonadota bacterium]MCP4918337.1 hypothetical protein [Pseudomonadota bacterium]